MLQNFTRILAVILATTIPFIFCDSTQDQRTVAEKLTQIFQNYDKNFRPNYGGSPVEVGLTAYVLAMPELDSSKQELVVDFYFRQFWNDTRLAYQDYNHTIVLPEDYSSKIWRPDTFFVNELQAQTHSVTVPNAFTKISPNGNVLSSARYTLRTTCPMNFRYFPFDEQLCSITIESFANTARDLTYKWAKGNMKSFGVSKELSQMGFKMVGHRGTTATETYGSESYTNAAVEIRFQRASGRYASEFFFPCMFLVLLSILTLFLGEPRIALIVNAMMMGFTILFLAISSGSMEAPSVSYGTSLDSFSSITYTFVFISFAISSVCLYMNKNNNGQGPIIVRHQDESDEEALRSNSNKQTPLPSTRIGAVGIHLAGLIARFLPYIRLGLIAIYLVTLLIFWTTAPFSQKTPENALLTDDWVTYQ